MSQGKTPSPTDFFLAEGLPIHDVRCGAAATQMASRQAGTRQFCDAERAQQQTQHANFATRMAGATNVDRHILSKSHP